MFLNPQHYAPEITDIKLQQSIERTIAFFEEKGLSAIKEQDQLSEWYADFIAFLKKEEVFYQLLVPEAFSEGKTRFDLSRVCEVSEILAFYGLSYQYAFQVSILGLGPVWMGSNQGAKEETEGLLKQGRLFAFGMSEKDHGADLYSNQMKLHEQEDGSYLASGEKYYIGNANEAAFVTVFGRVAETEEFVFFKVDPSHPNYILKKKIHTSGVRSAYVGEFALTDYPIKQDDILSQNKESWDSALSTINIGKFQLGFASVGICEHAFYEALDHATERVLYGNKVTELNHLRSLFTETYTRIVAMKLYAKRAVDYFRSSSEQDRRYLLFNPIQKMKVTTQGVVVIDKLLDIVAAKGFEQDTYMEMAIRDIGMIPRLEGTTHVNMALIVKFMENYFFHDANYEAVSQRIDAKDDANLFQQTAGKLALVTFPDYREVYEGVEIENVKRFFTQTTAFKNLLTNAPPTKEQLKNTDFMLHFGELFTNIVYAQLILENARLHQLDDIVINQLFDFLIKDQSQAALTQRMTFTLEVRQDSYLEEMTIVPDLNEVEKSRLWEKHVLALKGTYSQA